MIRSTEDLFHEAMRSNYNIAKKEASIDLKGFLKMIKSYGGLEAAKRLVKNPIPSDGFISLCEANRLNLTAEFLIVQEQWKQLFTIEEIEMARKKLKDFAFDATL